MQDSFSLKKIKLRRNYQHYNLRANQMFKKNYSE
jgi:hypothetical protein